MFLKLTGAALYHAFFQSTVTPLIVDAHCDLGWNMVNYQRNYIRSALETRAQEAGSVVERVAGKCMLGLPEWLQARVALLCGSIFVIPHRAVSSGRQLANYQTPEAAYRWGQQMLSAIEQLAATNESFVLVRTVADLETVLASWATPKKQIGILLAMEGADPIQTPDQLHAWYARGLRMVGLSWLRTRYAGGNAEPSGLTALGVQLLKEMKQSRLIFDTAHLAEQAFWNALDVWDGSFVYSHGIPRHFMAAQRALSDEQIKALAAREGVMGIGLYNGFYQLHRNNTIRVTITDVVNAIDYVCQLLGSSDYVAIGADFDGGFGAEAAPVGFNTVADLQRLPPALQAKGYNSRQIDLIMHGNWLRLFRQSLPS
jgi:membrane dipeptidase